MDAELVLNVIDTLEAASVSVYLDGGWGVDALLGEQTRPHTDLDLIASRSEGEKLRAALSKLGFDQKSGDNETNFVLADKTGREVDVHLIAFDQRGYGYFKFPDGRRWPFPSAAFAGQGRIHERVVRCLSVDAQVQCHGQGYEPTEKDLHDMERLQERFGIVLPVALCRQPITDRQSNT